MPIPSPRKNEEETKFIERCMGDKTMNKDYEDNKQRYAVCKTKWDKHTEAVKKIVQELES